MLAKILGMEQVPSIGVLALNARQERLRSSARSDDKLASADDAADAFYTVCVQALSYDKSPAAFRFVFGRYDFCVELEEVEDAKVFRVGFLISVDDFTRDMLARLDAIFFRVHGKIGELQSSYQIVRLETLIEPLFGPYAT